MFNEYWFSSKLNLTLILEPNLEYFFSKYLSYTPKFEPLVKLQYHNIYFQLKTDYEFIRNLALLL